MARAKAQELGPDSHVVSSDGMVRVPIVGFCIGLVEPNVVRTKFYPSKKFLEGFFRA